jgi:hypothetical protein
VVRAERVGDEHAERALAAGCAAQPQRERESSKESFGGMGGGGLGLRT